MRRACMDPRARGRASLGERPGGVAEPRTAMRRPDRRSPASQVGHFTDPRRPTGCTVVLCREAARSPASTCAARAPGTRETELLRAGEHGRAGARRAARRRQRLRPRRRRRRDALARRARHRLSQVGGRRAVPIVPAAILFDLLGRRRRASAPTPAAATPPAQAATATRRREGNVGAGAGAIGRQAVRHRAGDEGRHRQRVDHGRRHHGRARWSPSTRSAT